MLVKKLSSSLNNLYLDDSSKLNLSLFFTIFLLVQCVMLFALSEWIYAYIYIYMYV